MNKTHHYSIPWFLFQTKVSLRPSPGAWNQPSQHLFRNPRVASPTSLPLSQIINSNTNSISSSDNRHSLTLAPLPRDSPVLHDWWRRLPMSFARPGTHCGHVRAFSPMLKFSSRFPLSTCPQVRWVYTVRMRVIWLISCVGLYWHWRWQKNFSRLIPVKRWDKLSTRAGREQKTISH